MKGIGGGAIESGMKLGSSFVPVFCGICKETFNGWITFLSPMSVPLGRCKASAERNLKSISYFKLKYICKQRFFKQAGF